MAGFVMCLFSISLYRSGTRFDRAFTYRLEFPS